jgi:signal transduction histidine kinase
VSLDLAVPTDLPPVAGDPTELHQVLLELCVNARDAMPDGGTLRAAAHVTPLDPALPQLVPAVAAIDYVSLVVADTGTGIPARHLGRIFDPFFRMPRLDGPGLIRGLRARDARVPIIAASGLGTYAGPAQSASLGVARFLSKPFTASALLQAPAEVLRRD